MLLVHIEEANGGWIVRDNQGPDGEGEPFIFSDLNEACDFLTECYGKEEPK